MASTSAPTTGSPLSSRTRPTTPAKVSWLGT